MKLSVRGDRRMVMITRLHLDDNDQTSDMILLSLTKHCSCSAMSIFYFSHISCFIMYYKVIA
jgi:hypothetical protein